MDVFGSRIEEVKLFKNHSNMLLNEQTDSRKSWTQFSMVSKSACVLFFFLVSSAFIYV